MKIKYLTVSDIHLGNRLVPTEYTITNLKRELFADDKKDLDILFIAGDLFDMRLDFDSPEVHCIIVFLTQLLLFCSENKIKLRVLEGTPSHDWRQSQVITKLNSTLKEPCDLKYYPILIIEHMVDLGIYILYVPDEWTNKEEELIKDINLQLKEHSIKQVDIAMMHGHFKYQSIHMPDSSIKFDEAYFLNLVKHYINIGHIHIHTHYERIIAQGSFERLAHSQEESKGYTIAQIDTATNKRSWDFCINKNAMIFKTIKVTNGMNINKLDKLISKLPKNCFVRLAMKKDHPLNANFEELKLRYLDCNIKRQIIDNSGVSVNTYISTDDIDIDMSSVTLNEGNLMEKLKDLINIKSYDFKDRHWDYFNKYLKPDIKLESIT